MKEMFFIKILKYSFDNYFYNKGGKNLTNDLN